MAKAEYWQRGEALDYVNSGDTAIEANTIVKIGAHLGVAGGTIPAGETGVLHVGGVWDVPKTGTNAISMGQSVYWDGSGITDAADDGGSPATAYPLVGYAAAAAAAAATVIRVKLNG